MSTTFKLTQSAVKALPLIQPDDKKRQRLYFDTELKGLGICVGAKAKSFFVQRDINGKSVRTTIGRYGVYTVEQARDEARELLLKMSKGFNPNKEDRADRSLTVTLRDGLELHLMSMKAKGRSARTTEDYTYRMTRYLPDWLDRPLATITRTEARERHHQIATDIAAGKYATVTPKNGRAYTKERNKDSGRYQANSVFRVFRAIHNRVAREHEGLPENPCIAVDWYREDERDAAIAEKDLSRWYADVRGMDNPVRRDYLLLVLFTALRRASAASIKWVDVKWDDRALYIGNPKGGKDRAFHLPLSDFLIDLLKKRQGCELTQTMFPKSPYVFPAESKSGHISEPKVKLSVPFTVHGLRHTFITQAYQLGIPEPVIQVLVNHSVSARSSRKITRTYYTPDQEYLRRPMQQITDRLRALCLGETKSNRKRSSPKK